MSYIEEAVREWKFAVGRECPNECWLLSDYDTWERNPFYQGHEQPHPEYDHEYDEEDGMTDVEADADTLRNAGWGTDEDYNGWEPDYNDDIPF